MGKHKMESGKRSMKRAEIEYDESNTRAQLEHDLERGAITIMNGWLVEVADAHTCGTDASGHYGVHEPGCGYIPIFDIAAAMQPKPQSGGVSF